MGVTHHKKGNRRMAIITGGDAGAHTVTGIATVDTLEDVWQLVVGTDGTFTSSTNLLSEFSISAASEITNTTTDTTNGMLFVFWRDKDAT